MWSRYGPGENLLRLKQQAWERTEEHLSPLRELFPSVEVDRQFPFVAIRTARSDLDALAVVESESIGRILTGGYDFEAQRFLTEHIRMNISRRSYEMFLLTWTDALGVYSNAVDESNYELTFM